MKALKLLLQFRIRIGLKNTVKIGHQLRLVLEVLCEALFVGVA